MNRDSSGLEKGTIGLACFWRAPGRVSDSCAAGTMAISNSTRFNSTGDSVMIPSVTSYSATVSGAVPKLVQCESCNAEYVYQLERTASGLEISPLSLDNAGASK